MSCYLELLVERVDDKEVEVNCIERTHSLVVSHDSLPPEM